MSNPQDILKKLTAKHSFFVGVDSDGCVFDTMEIKHKECFCPAFIHQMGFQTISKYAREVWDYVNLYSGFRGLNRFLALIEAIKLLENRSEVKERGIILPDTQPLKEWTQQEGKLGEATLEKYMETHSAPILTMALAWSKDLNARIADMVYGIAPFPFVGKSLEKLSASADVLVVSQTPIDALQREWNEHGIAKYTIEIAGQEMGTKSEHLQLATKGKYDINNVLMIGDAPGDLKSAKNNGFLFYPIVPGIEDESWKKFYNEAIDKFFDGTYKGSYEKKLINDFNRRLSDTPPWEA